MPIPHANIENATKMLDGRASARLATRFPPPTASSVQDLIDKAKSHVAAGQYAEAMKVLQQLAGQKLSGNQQGVVDGLKAQIQKALGATSAAPTGAAGAADSLLKK